MSDLDIELLLERRRQRERSLKAALEADSPQRDRRHTLPSISDDDEDSKVTQAIVQGAVQGALEAEAELRKQRSDRVQFGLPGGWALNGRIGSLLLLVVAVVAAVTFVAWVLRWGPFAIPAVGGK